MLTLRGAERSHTNLNRHMHVLYVAVLAGALPLTTTRQYHMVLKMVSRRTGCGYTDMKLFPCLKGILLGRMEWMWMKEAREQCENGAICCNWYHLRALHNI